MYAAEERTSMSVPLYVNNYMKVVVRKIINESNNTMRGNSSSYNLNFIQNGFQKKKSSNGIYSDARKCEEHFT